MIYNYTIANKELTLTEGVLKSRLEAIGNLNGKKVAWIRSDLSVKRSNRITRMIWSVVAKHFSLIRKTFFGVDLKQSRSLLEQFGKQITKSSAISEVFDKAVVNFNQIAPRHSIDPEVLSLAEDLASWAPDVHPGEILRSAATKAAKQKSIAAERILSAFKNSAIKLDLSCLDLSEPPPCIEKLTKLKLLWLRNNKLESLPPEIGNITQLLELVLRNNKLVSLPPEIGNLTQLKNLSSSNNKLVSLPPEIGNLTQLWILGLGNNKLVSLPPEIGNLTQLKNLSLGNNLLESLPAEIGQLSQLKRLRLNNNKLESPPAEIWQLTQLGKLDLRDNKLESLPPEIGQLTQLWELVLRNNKLESLPPEIGQLSQLGKLDLRDNINLTELPLSLSQIPELTWIFTDGTGISDEQRDAILSQCKALREAQAAKILPTRLKTWKVTSKSECDLSGVENFDDNKKIRINEWLVRLEKTKDFNTASQAALAKTVCRMLEDVIKNEAFRELFFVQVASNLECCEDRAAMALNEIYTSWKITQLDDVASIDEKLQVMARGAKTLALRAAIAKCINQHQQKTHNIEKEAVEIYLYYETALKNKLGLLSAINKMAYEGLGKRDWIDQKGLIKAVDTTYLDFLIEFPVFEKIIASDPAYQSAFSKQVKPFEDKITALFGSEPKNADELSPEHLNWQTNIGDLNAQMKSAVSKAKKECALEKLK